MQYVRRMKYCSMSPVGVILFDFWYSFGVPRRKKDGATIGLDNLATCFCFETVPDCDRQIDGRTDISTTANTALCSASCGKK